MKVKVKANLFYKGTIIPNETELEMDKDIAEKYLSIKAVEVIEQNIIKPKVEKAIPKKKVKTK